MSMVVGSTWERRSLGSAARREPRKRPLRSFMNGEVCVCGGGQGARSQGTWCLRNPVVGFESLSITDEL